MGEAHQDQDVAQAQTGQFVRTLFRASHVFRHKEEDGGDFRGHTVDEVTLKRTPTLVSKTCHNKDRRGQAALLRPFFQ
jgi:hypothetical protein